MGTYLRGKRFLRDKETQFRQVYEGRVHTTSLETTLNNGGLF